MADGGSGGGGSAAVSGGSSSAALEVAAAPGNRAGVDAVVVPEASLGWLSSGELEALPRRSEGKSGVVDESEPIYMNPSVGASMPFRLGGGLEGGR